MKESIKLIVTAIAMFGGCFWGAYAFIDKTLVHQCEPHTVQNVQRACNAEGANLTVDGVPGTKTIEAWVPLSQAWNEHEIAKRVRDAE
jgi:hypothetical protein